MERIIVNPWSWQEPHGFVQGLITESQSRTLYVSGQTSSDEDGAPVHDADLSAQLQKATDNLERVLSEAGFPLSSVVRLNAYTTDMDAMLPLWDDEVVPRLRAADCDPTSTFLGVARLALPKLMVELEATAAL